MTCIVGIEHPGGVMIGGDSAGVAGLSITVRADAKVFANGPYVMGFTDSFRMGQLLRYRLVPPIPVPEEIDDLDRFMSTAFVDTVRTTLREGGYMKGGSATETPEEGGTFLVGICGRLYAVEEDFQVGRSTHGYEAVGCGRDLALGSLYTTTRMKPDKRIKWALSAASEFSGGVTPPFVIFNAPRDLDL